jgi:hypothetical protein
MKLKSKANSGKDVKITMMLSKPTPTPQNTILIIHLSSPSMCNILPMGIKFYNTIAEKMIP